MTIEYLLACGVVWQRTADPEAGWELIHALDSDNPSERNMAAFLLVDAGLISLSLLREAVNARVLSMDRGTECIVQVLATEQPQAPLGPVNAQEC